MVTLVLALPKQPRKQVVMAKTNLFPRKKNCLERKERRRITKPENVFLGKMTKPGISLQRPKTPMRCLARAQSRPRTEQARTREPSHPSNVETIPKVSMLGPSIHHSSRSRKAQHGLQLSSSLRWHLNPSMVLSKTTIQIRCNLSLWHQPRSLTLVCQ